ncbi:hypothetical protein Peur_000247 [Populus x canadensis]
MKGVCGGRLLMTGKGGCSRLVGFCFRAEGKENGDGCGRRNDDGKEGLEVLYGFGPRRGEGRRLLSFVGNECEQLGKEGES